jgi:mono/diheme cytochrome c family protein
MIRVRSALLVSLLVLTATTMTAGGWAVVTLDELPDRIEAGRPVTLTFMVRQHGVTPLPSLSPTVEATAVAKTISANATAGAKTGQYVATLTLPRAGAWTITIHSGFITSKLTLLPLAVVDPGGPAEPAASAMEVGRRLFVAKGCVTCHTNDLGSSNESLNSGPVLVAKKYQDEFLARVLENPAAVLPARPQAGPMPNLDLKAKEISALVTFINHRGSAATSVAQKQR